MRIIAEDRGNSLVSSMVGAIVGIMLLGLIASGLAVFMNFYINIGAANAVTAQKSLVEQQLRNDVALAANIASPTAGNTGFTAVTPSPDSSTCVETTWSLVSKDSKKQLIRSAKTYEEVLAPVTNSTATAGSITGASMCGGEMLHEHSETMLNDAGDSAVFAYTNAGGTQLTKSGSEMAAAPASGQTLLQQARLESTRIAGIKLTAKAAASGNKASDIKIIQYANNLESKSLPMTSSSIKTFNLGG